MAKEITWTTEKRKLSDLAEWAKNPRQLSKHDGEHLTRSIRKFGLADPLIINLDNSLIGGHQRKKVIEAMKELGGDVEIDCRVPSRLLDAKEAEELAIRLNRNQGEWSSDDLANGFEVEDLLNWGFVNIDLGIDSSPLPDFKEYDESVEDDVQYILTVVLREEG